ncbi:MAG: anti-sigma factor family protein [Pyrinomonadaceae bacterium]
MSAMQCLEFCDLADAFLSEELSDTLAHNMMEHFESCAACRSELAARRDLRERLRAACASAPDAQVRPEFVGRLRFQIRAAAASPNTS